MVPVKVVEAVTPAASRIVTVAVVAPTVVGVPLMVPVELSKLRPAGRALVENVHGLSGQVEVSGR